jgi:hypothetical protein
MADNSTHIVTVVVNYINVAFCLFSKALYTKVPSFLISFWFSVDIRFTNLNMLGCFL